MKRRYVGIIAFAVLAIAGCFIWFGDPYRSDDPVGVLPRFIARLSLPRPHSDVPITSDIGWWAYQEGLKVTEFGAEAVNPKLGLFSIHFLIRYHLRGTVKFREEWRPRIAEAQITERVVSRPGGFESSVSVANVLIVPVVEVRQDRRYSGEEIPFDVTLEQVVETMNWGRNVYEISCGDKTASVSVVQIK
jgi:hypothetical protein